MGWGRLGSWGCLGMVLGPFWIHFGSILDAFSGAFWDSLDVSEHCIFEVCLEFFMF